MPRFVFGDVGGGLNQGRTGLCIQASNLTASTLNPSHGGSAW